MPEQKGQNHEAAGQDVCDNCKILRDKHELSEARIKYLHDYNVEKNAKTSGNT